VQCKSQRTKQKSSTNNISFCHDSEEEKVRFEGVKRQSENRRYPGKASIAGGSPQPSKLARTCHPHCRLGEDPGPPIAKEKTKCVCLRNGNQYRRSGLALEMLHLVLCWKKHSVNAARAITSSSKARRVFA